MESALIQEMYQRQDHHWWFQGRARIVGTLIARFASRAPERGRPLRLCDVGCGTGANLRMLAEFGQVWGSSRPRTPSSSPGG
jgi:hypothetical protein